MNQDIPWVEKYRPNTFDKIILDKNNKIIIKNILKGNTFPNLLLYGPPGTGKTTTIINIITEFQKKNNEEHKDLIIHLNASDDRGIDIIRNQILNFVTSSQLFNKGVKFVILDEVDYMTKSAQIALKYLIETCNKNVRFCLICNYISKIDKILQSEFIRLKFNMLPEKHIEKFLVNIVEKEKLSFNPGIYKDIIKNNNSDVRSMINQIQNYNNELFISVLNANAYDILIDYIQNKPEKKAIELYNSYLIQYNIEKYRLTINLFYHILNKKKYNRKFLNIIEIIIHTNEYDYKGFDKFLIHNLRLFIN